MRVESSRWLAGELQKARMGFRRCPVCGGRAPTLELLQRHRVRSCVALEGPARIVGRELREALGL